MKLPATRLELEAAVELGYAQSALGEYEAASAAFGRAADAGEAWAYDGSALVCHMRCLLRAGRPGDAAALFEKRRPAAGRGLWPPLACAAADAFVAHADKALADSQGLNPIGRHLVANRVLRSGHAALSGDKEDAAHAAQRVWQRLVQVQTQLARLLYEQGQAALTSQNAPAACEAFALLMRECPNADPAVRLPGEKAYGRFYEESGGKLSQAFDAFVDKDNLEAAIAAFHAIAEAYPYIRAGIQAHFYEAKYLALVGRTAEAKSLFERHVRK
jgi:tetratricopeptide (TPR) repeat protein